MYLLGFFFSYGATTFLVFFGDWTPNGLTNLTDSLMTSNSAPSFSSCLGLMIDDLLETSPRIISLEPLDLILGTWFSSLTVAEATVDLLVELPRLTGASEDIAEEIAPPVLAPFVLVLRSYEKPL